MENEVFRNNLICAIIDLRNTVFSPQRTDEFLQQIENEWESVVIDYFLRFGPEEVAEMSEQEKRDYFSSMISRMQWFYEHRSWETIQILQEYTGKTMLEVNITGCENKEITINGEEIYYEGSEWTGLYLPETEITLSVKDEKQFQGWYNDKDELLGKDYQYSFEITKNVNIIAKFE